MYEVPQKADRLRAKWIWVISTHTTGVTSHFLVFLGWSVRMKVSVISKPPSISTFSVSVIQSLCVYEVLNSCKYVLALGSREAH